MKIEKLNMQRFKILSLYTMGFVFCIVLSSRFLAWKCLLDIELFIWSLCLQLKKKLAHEANPTSEILKSNTNTWDVCIIFSLYYPTYILFVLYVILVSTWKTLSLTTIHDLIRWKNNVKTKASFGSLEENWMEWNGMNKL